MNSIMNDFDNLTLPFFFFLPHSTTLYLHTFIPKLTWAKHLAAFCVVCNFSLVAKKGKKVLMQ